jgi:hypothetical protein
VIVPDITVPGFANPNVLVTGAVKFIVTTFATAGEPQFRIAVSAIMPPFKKRGFMVIPKAKFDICRSGDYQCWLRLPPISHKADASKAKDHHRPGGWLGDSRCKRGHDINRERITAAVQKERKGVCEKGRAGKYLQIRAMLPSDQSVTKTERDKLSV